MRKTKTPPLPGATVPSEVEDIARALVATLLIGGNYTERWVKTRGLILRLQDDPLGAVVVAALAAVESDTKGRPLEAQDRMVTAVDRADRARDIEHDARSAIS